VPRSALLTAADFGPGWRAEEGDDLGLDGPDWLWEAHNCPAYAPDAHPALQQRGPFRALTYVPSGADGPEAGELVRRLPAGLATGVIGEIRNVLAVCSDFRLTGPPVWDDVSGMDVRLREIDSGLAGDESLLVQEVTTVLAGRPLAADGPPRITYHLIIRRADMLAWLDVDPAHEALARRLAQRMADRLG
jgi:hypothetical protein